MAIKICSQSNGAGPGGLVQSGEHSPVLLNLRMVFEEKGQLLIAFSLSLLV